MHALKLKTIILATLISLCQISFSEAASNNAVRSAFYAGPSFQYEALSVTPTGKVYNGLLYGLVFGRDFHFSNKWGLSASLAMHGGTIVNQAQASDLSKVFIPSFGLGVNFSVFTANVITTYNYYSGTAGQSENLGLKGEGIVHWITGKSFEFQFGGSLGQTLYYSKSATTVDLFLRTIWFFKGGE